MRFILQLTKRSPWTHTLAPLLVGLLTFIGSLSIQAQVEVTVPRQVALGDSFQLIYTVSGAISKGDFSAPAFSPDLEVLFGPQINVLTMAGRGNRTPQEKSTIVYTLQASKVGKLTIGTAQLKVGGKSYTAPRQVVSVVQAKGLATEPLAQGDKFEIAPGDMYLQAVVSPREVYLQQPVLVSLYLYSRYGNLAGVGRTPPEVTNFVTKELPLGQTSLTTEQVGGRLMFKALVWQMLAYPQSSGELQIPAFGYEFQVSVQRRVQSEEEIFGNKGMITVRKKLESKPIAIHVKELPAGAPEGFEQVVGQYQLSATLQSPSQEQYKTGEPILYTLDITGAGGTSLLLSPRLELPDALEVYDPEVQHDEVDLQRTSARIHRTLVYSIVPRTAGKYTIPPIELHYFDPQSAQYHTTRTQSFEIDVVQGSVDTSQVDRSNRASSSLDTSPLDKAAPPIIGWAPLTQAGWAYWLLHLVPVGVLIGCIRRKVRQADVVTYHKQTAHRETHRALLQVGALLKQQNSQEAARLLLSTLYQHLQWSFDLPTSTLTRSNLLSTLEAHQLPPEQVREWMNLIGELEYRVYSRAADQEALDSLYHSAGRLIDSLPR